MQRIEVVVKGRVQGVFFRSSVKDKARTLGLKGWVRNEGSDMVHIVAEGDEKVLDDLVRFARDGPPAAEVTDIDVKRTAPKKEFDSFVIRY